MAIKIKQPLNNINLPEGKPLSGFGFSRCALFVDQIDQLSQTAVPATLKIKNETWQVVRPLIIFFFFQLTLLLILPAVQEIRNILIDCGKQ